MRGSLRAAVGLVTLLGAAALTGCPGEPREEADLVLATDWDILDDADDPFPEHAAQAKRRCYSGFGEYLGLLDIDTNQCGYVSAAQPTLADVHAGDAVAVLAWHQALASTDPDAQGHMALVLDGELLWELVVDIPAAAAIHEVLVPIERDVPAGSEIVVHVHNHGGNTWRLSHVRVVPSNLLTDEAP